MATTVTIGGSGTLFVGEDKLLRFEVLEERTDGLPHDASSVPVDLAGMVLLFDIRKKDNSPEPAIVSITPTITGVYNVVRATNTQRASVQLTDTHMNLFQAKTYRYSVKRMDDTSETVLVRGDFAPEKATAP